MPAIARALLLNPSPLVLDEPSQGLAPIMVQDIFHIIRHMRAEGISVLLVEWNVRLNLESAVTVTTVCGSTLVQDTPEAHGRQG
jgi:branched-chain amino acid transport system ATP-binding protein